MRVLDLTGRTAVSIDIETSLAAEMLAEIMEFTWSEVRSTLDRPKRWFDELRTKISTGLRSDLDRLVGGGDSPVGGGLMSAIWEHPATPDVAGFIARVEAMTPRQLRLAGLGYHITEIRERLGRDIEAAADGDREAFERLVADPGWESDRGKKASLRHFFDLPAREAHALTLRVLRAWYDEVFRDHEDAVDQILRRDAEAKRSLAPSMTPEALVELATGGVQTQTQPYVRRTLLVPHVAMRPWNLLNEYEALFIIHYPVADETLGVDRDAPPPRLLRLFRALGDEKRLRMLRVLARGSASLPELAEGAGVAKSTAHHHTVILRSAGLIRVGLERESRYSLRTEAIREVGGWLERFLKEAG